MKNWSLSKLLVLSAETAVLCRQRQQMKSLFPFPSQRDALGFASYPLLLFLSILLCSSVWVAFFFPFLLVVMVIALCAFYKHDILEELSLLVTDLISVIC